MEKPPGVVLSTTFLNNIPLINLSQKEIVSFAKKIFNGSSKDLLFKVETDLQKCQKLWEKFSPNQSLFDLWDLRLAFWRGYHCEPYFITLTFQDDIISVLPLWFDTEDQQYTWFGGSWPDENIFFTKTPATLPLLLKLIPGKVRLFCIRNQEGIITKQGFLEPDEEKYVLDIKNFQSLDDFWKILKKKKRYNLKRDCKRIQAFKPQIIYDKFSSLEYLFKLNIVRFDNMLLEESKSNFLPKEKQAAFKEIVNLAKDYQVRMITIIINNRVVSVDLVAIYKKVYYCLGGGCDVENYSGLGAFANLQLISDAISLGTNKIDFLQGDLNWKASWKLTPVPLFKFAKDT